MDRTVIRATGRYVPERVVTNADLTQWMDTSDEWIQQRTGIVERHWISEEGSTGASDLGYHAACVALTRAGWRAADLDMIIFATVSPDLFFPGSGCLLQEKLGIPGIPALDIRQQCTGFLYGMEVADAYIRARMARRILLVCAEVHSTGLDISTRGRDVAVIFGDGAAAVCLESVDSDAPIGMLVHELHADGRLADRLMTEAPASRCWPRIDHAMLDAGRHYPFMDGRTIFKKAVRLLPEVARSVMDRAGVDLEDIALIIPHQANLRINQAFQHSLDIPEDRVFHNIQRYGNTTAASIPLALDEALAAGRVGRSQDLLMFIGLGSGLTWGASLYRFP